MNYNDSGALLQINGDGFGAGWYTGQEQACVVKGREPVWNDNNFINISKQTESGLFMAHVRLTTTGEVHRENSHPFSYKNWIFQHNGSISEFPKVRRDLQVDIAPDLYPELKGNTDSETIFLLALTYGLNEQPKKALRLTIKRLQQAAKDNNTDGGLNLSCAMSDGKNLYTIRFGENVEQTNTQFYSENSTCLEDFASKCTPLPKQSVVVVSEPLDGLTSKWNKVPENSFLKISNDEVIIQDLMEI